MRLRGGLEPLIVSLNNTYFIIFYIRVGVVVGCVGSSISSSSVSSSSIMCVVVVLVVVVVVVVVDNNNIYNDDSVDVGFVVL